MHIEYIQAFHQGVCAISALLGLVFGFSFWLYVFNRVGGAR